MKRIWIIFLAALALLAPLAAPGSPGDDGRVQAAMDKLKALRVGGIEFTLLKAEAGNIRVEGLAYGSDSISILKKAIEADIGSARMLELSYTVNGVDRPPRGFKILVTPYAVGAQPPVPAAAVGS